jgi:hypothetical protein
VKSRCQEISNWHRLDQAGFENVSLLPRVKRVVVEIFPAAIVVFVIWGLAVLKSPDWGYYVTIAVTPFGMFAAFALLSLGGLSLLVSSLLAGLMIGVGALRFFRPSHGEHWQRMPGAMMALLVFGAYSIFSAIILVRIFAGDFRVFSLSRSVEGVRIDPNFGSITVPLAPGGSNISQTFYLVLACGFFVVLYDFLRRRGAIAGENALRIAAVVNIVLGFLDLLGFDSLMAPIRTATYTLANEQMMGGFERIIGGFSEPSSFGTASAIFFAYFTSAFFHSHKLKDLFPALLNAFFVIASFAATGMFAAFMVCLVLLFRGRVVFYGRHSRDFVLIAAAMGLIGLAAVALIMALTPLPDVIADVFDRMILSKADSMSGLERKAWAEGGIHAFVQTWGLGAGVGSLRSNGLIPVMLGSVGIPGTVAYFVFIWLSVGRSAPVSDLVMRRVYLSARLGVVAKLSADFLSSTVPDPGLITMTLAATALVARQSALARQPVREASDLGLQPSR